MKKSITTALVVLALAAGASSCKQDKMQENPFLAEYDTPFEIPPFEKIKLEHYLPALQAGIDQQNAEIEAIVANEETPTFDNTILALDRSGRTLDKVAAVYFALSE
ncbi:MAG: peptidase M3, partial [Muribaculaceae bacterium]|nr:peptidase M3 [Muribaculaceae bacterium]